MINSNDQTQQGSENTQEVLMPQAAAQPEAQQTQTPTSNPNDIYPNPQTINIENGETASVVPSNNNEAIKKKRSPVIKVIIAILILAVMGGGGFLIYQKQMANKITNVTVQTKRGDDINGYKMIDYASFDLPDSWVIDQGWPKNIGTAIALFPSKDELEKAKNLPSGIVGSRFPSVRTIQGNRLGLEKILTDPKINQSFKDKASENPSFQKFIDSGIPNTKNLLCTEMKNNIWYEVDCYFITMDDTFYNIKLSSDETNFTKDYEIFVKVISTIKDLDK